MGRCHVQTHRPSSKTVRRLTQHNSHVEETSWLITGYYVHVNEQQAISDEGKGGECNKALPTWQRDNAKDERQNSNNRSGKEQHASRVAEDESVLAANECYQDQRSDGCELAEPWAKLLNSNHGQP